MAEMHPTAARLYEAAELSQKGSVTQAELARLLNTTSQVIKNWESRGVSKAGATTVQAALGVNATFVLEGTGPALLTPPTGGADPSQAERLDFQTIGDAVEVLRRYLAILGKDPKWVSNPEMLEVAFAVVSESEETVTSNNVIDFTERLARKLREAGGKGNERGTLTRVGIETG